MFPDSKVSKNGAWSWKSLCYVVNNGIVPYLKKNLKDKILLFDCFVVGFDESLNQVTQQ